MTPSELYDHVAAHLPDGELDAPRVTRHVLTALAARLTPAEAAEIGTELPEELGDILAAAHGTGRLDRDELIEHMAEALDLDDTDAEEMLTAVLAGIREYLEPVVAIEQMLALLPPDLAQLMS
jgi:uncharacterized protein (DUF2267 family)